MAHQLYVLQVLTFNLLEERMMTKMDPNDQVGAKWGSCFLMAVVQSSLSLCARHCAWSLSAEVVCICPRKSSMICTMSQAHFCPAVVEVMPPKGLIGARVWPGKA